jgi:Predicted permeases
MTEQFLIIGKQVLILFILMGTGFIADKARLVSVRGTRQISAILAYIVTPCVMLEAFSIPFEGSKVTGFFIAFALALLTHGIGILLAFLLVRDKSAARQKVLRFSVIFSNCGFMGIPLLKAVLGNTGVFYGSAYIAAMNIIMWTFGVWLYTGKTSKKSIAKAMLNPAVFSVFVSCVLYFCQITLPEILFIPVTSIAAINTPLAMIVIGCYLSRANVFEALKDIKMYVCLALRLVAVPLIMLAIFKLLLFLGINIDNTISAALIIVACCPAAGNTAILAGLFGADERLGAKLVAVSTLVSIITIPLIASLILI